jgi:competence protein ComEA
MLKKIIEGLRDYFGISRKEARGALVLMVLCFLILWMPFIFRRWVLPIFPTMSEPIDLKKLDSIAFELEEENQVKYKKREPRRGQDRSGNIRPLSKPFDFDPNQASVEELMKLGVPAFLASRIENFRNKGGQFRRKEDLLHIYDFPAELYKRLEPHIVLRNNTKVAISGKPLPRVAEVREVHRKPVPEVFDINTADTVQLMKLRGIGSKLSLRIVKFRDALGGFYAASQYTEIFGLDSLALAELNRYCKVISPVRKININAVTAAELGRHSYMRDRKLVSVLINYRNQHGAFHNIDDLKNTRVLDENLIKKIEPYISFGL